MKRSKLRKKSKQPAALAKDEIQNLLRQLAILTYGECWVKQAGITEMGECNDVLQYDHLETRAKNISYADFRLGVLVCKRHHWYHGSPRKEQVTRYEELARGFIGKERAALWDRVRADNRAYPMGAYEWTKIIWDLKQRIKSVDNSK